MRFKKEFVNSIWYKDHRKALKNIDEFHFDKELNSASTQNAHYSIYLYRKEVKNRWGLMSRISGFTPEIKTKFSQRFPFYAIYEEFLISSTDVGTNDSHLLVEESRIQFYLHVKPVLRFPEESLAELKRFQEDRDRRRKERESMNEMIGALTPLSQLSPADIEPRRPSLFERIMK